MDCKKRRCPSIWDFCDVVGGVFPYSCTANYIEGASNSTMEWEAKLGKDDLMDQVAVHFHGD